MIHTLVRRRDDSEWHVFVPAGDLAAIARYEKLGMTVEQRSTIVRVSRAGLPRVDALALPVMPEEDDDIERALGMLAGRIAMLRKRPSARLVQLRDAGCAPVGFAAYDPIGALGVLRVARPELAGTLIDALDVPREIEVDIEDDHQLRALLVAAGGRVQLELVHYRAAI